MKDPIVTHLKDAIEKSEAHTRKLKKTLATYLDEPEDEQPEFEEVKSETTNDLSGYSQVEAVYRVLGDSTSPLTYSEIIDFAQKRGKAITASSLPSLLSRNDKFASQGGGRWTLSALADKA